MSRDITPRQLIEAQRAAWLAGTRSTPSYGAGVDLVKRLYPMPAITQPREISVGAYMYRVANGKLMYRSSVAMGCWEESAYPLAVIPALAELIANPTETIKDNG